MNKVDEATDWAEHRERRAEFELYEDGDGEWRWRLRHRSGNVLAGDGQRYAGRSGIWEGIESVKRNAPDAAVEETSG